MKYITLRDFQTITDALNFSTRDCHIVGNCDLYTTKAAGGDKKLYKNIETSLESQHQDLVRLSASISPPQLPVDAKSRQLSFSPPEIDLSRNSPFGPLSQISARRTFAYLIATLNASHPDYDFSNTLRPSDFRKTSMTSIRLTVDSTMQNLRPRSMSALLAPPSRLALSNSAPSAYSYPSGEVIWNERMWDMIDKELELKSCEKYVWEPEEDPFDDERSLWSQHYLLFNKDKKRVCYLHFRAFSILSHSPIRMTKPTRARSVPRVTGAVTIGEGAGKRAQYWLGHSVKGDDLAVWDEVDDDDDDDEEMEIDPENDEEYYGDYQDDLDTIREHLAEGHYAYDDEDEDGVEVTGWTTEHRGSIRGQSEGMADAMEI